MPRRGWRCGLVSRPGVAGYQTQHDRAEFLLFLLAQQGDEIAKAQVIERSRHVSSACPQLPDGVEKIEEYWLEPAGVYRLVHIHTRRLTMDNPIPIDLRFDELNLP